MSSCALSANELASPPPSVSISVSFCLSLHSFRPLPSLLSVWFPPSGIPPSVSVPFPPSLWPPYPPLSSVYQQRYPQTQTL